MKYVFPILGSFAILVGAIGYWLGMSERQPMKVTSTTSGHQEYRDRNDLSSLEATIARIEQRLQQLELRQLSIASGVSAVPQPAERQPPVPPNPEDRMEHLRDIAAQNNAEFEKRLNTESRDQTWATATEDSVRNAAKQAAGGGSYSFTGLNCLTSICKAQVHMPTLDSSRELSQNLLMSVPGLTGFETSMPEKLADGTYSARLKLFRKGYPMPGQDEAI